MTPESIAAALAASLGGPNSRIPARVRGTAWPHMRASAADSGAGASMGLTITEFAAELSAYGQTTVPKEDAVCFTLGTSARGGSSDLECTGVWGVLLDSDGSGAWEPLLAALDAAGVGYVGQRRAVSGAEASGKFHVSLFYAEPLTPTVEEKPLYISVVRFLLRALGALAGVKFDRSQASRFLPMTFAYTRRPSDGVDAAGRPAVEVETVAREGAALNLGAFLAALGFDPAAEAARAAAERGAVPVPAAAAGRAERPTLSGADGLLSPEEVRALVGAAAVRVRLTVPDVGAWDYESKRRDTTRLVRAAIELAGVRATDIDQDDLREAVIEFFGADRKHIADGARLVDSAVARAFAPSGGGRGGSGGAPGKSKPEEVAKDARIIEALRRKPPGNDNGGGEGGGGEGGAAPAGGAISGAAGADANPASGAAGGGVEAFSAVTNRLQFPEWHNVLVQPEGRGPLVVFGEPSDLPRRGAQQAQDGKYRVQVQPNADLIAEHAREIARWCPVIVVSHAGFGNKFYAVDDRNLATATSVEAFVAAIFETCAAMMGGKNPTPAVFKTAAALVTAIPRAASELSILRWNDESKLALHEMPRPVTGDWSAHREFTDRASCPDTLMAWTWTCFLPERATGREALFLFGEGNDGKSVWAENLMRFMGNGATASEILKGENRFELANLIDKRLVYFGDVRNPRPIHSKIMREIISGAYLSFERKGKDMEAAFVHPRCLFTSNVEPRILVTDRAEFTRVRRINVRPLPANDGDRAWPRRLAEQMPAFLWACREVYERFADEGHDLPITDACRAALAGGTREVEDEFDSLAAHIEITGEEEHFITAKRMVELFDMAKYRGWERTNARQWLLASGARKTGPNGEKLVKKLEKKTVAIWRGVREIDGGVFGNIQYASVSRN